MGDVPTPPPSRQAATRWALDTFFAGRTVGYQEWARGWHWRGEGYDEGWDVMTDDEVRELRRLINEAWEATQPDYL